MLESGPKSHVSMLVLTLGHIAAASAAECHCQILLFECGTANSPRPRPHLLLLLFHNKQTGVGGRETKDGGSGSGHDSYPWGRWQLQRGRIAS